MPSLPVSSLNAQYTLHRLRYPATAPMMLSFIETGRPITGSVPTRLSSKPTHMSGKVMLSGSSCVSKSMTASAIRNHVSSNAAPVYQWNPNLAATSADRTAVESSTIG